MFISFFTGKVMLFYGISLIMKEKSNASALAPRCVRLWGQTRLRLLPRSLTDFGIDLSTRAAGGEWREKLT